MVVLRTSCREEKVRESGIENIGDRGPQFRHIEIDAGNSETATDNAYTNAYTGQTQIRVRASTLNLAKQFCVIRFLAWG